MNIKAPNIPMIIKTGIFVIILLASLAIFLIVPQISQHVVRVEMETSFCVNNSMVHGVTSKSVNPIDANLIIKDRFTNRNQVTHRICSKFSPDYVKRLGKRVPFLNFANGYFQWCRILKVASSFLEKLDKRITLMKTGKNLRHSKHGSKYTFAVVREPYAKMVSGYIDRVVTFPLKWSEYGADIVKKFRKNSYSRGKPCGHDVTFPEFVKYFIYSMRTGWNEDMHFLPEHHQCNPCTSSFDFICHLETIQEDVSYILGLANITIEKELEDTQSLIQEKAKNQVSQKELIKKCQSMCSYLRNFWWSLQARGFIARDIPFPFQEKECDNISQEALAEKCWQAHLQSVGRIDKAKEMRRTIVDLFLQVPLEDRIEVKDILFLDFKLFGYEAQPADLFPELAVT